MILSALIYSAVQKGLDLGSLADWVSGGATAIGVWVALLTAEKASREARAATLEAKKTTQEDRRRVLFREHYMAYAAALNVVKVAAHRINSTHEAVLLAKGIQKLTALLLIRMIEADKALVQSVNLVLLDPRTAHQVTSVAGSLSAAVDALNTIVEANPTVPEEIERETSVCKHNIKTIVAAI